MSYNDFQVSGLNNRGHGTRNMTETWAWEVKLTQVLGGRQRTRGTCQEYSYKVAGLLGTQTHRAVKWPVAFHILALSNWSSDGALTGPYRTTILATLRTIEEPLGDVSCLKNVCCQPQKEP